jgi:hypothetical protein
MRFTAPVSFLALVALALAEEASTSDVLSLTASTFDSTVNAEPLILVEFFAPWYVSPVSYLTSHLYSLRTGADTVKHWHHTTRKLQRLSRRKTSRLPRSTVLTRPISASQKEFKATRKHNALRYWIIR